MNDKTPNNDKPRIIRLLEMLVDRSSIHTDGNDNDVCGLCKRTWKETEGSDIDKWGHPHDPDCPHIEASKFLSEYSQPNVNLYKSTRQTTVAALQKIGSQILTDEMDEHSAARQCADYEEGYNTCIRIARDSLNLLNNQYCV